MNKLIKRSIALTMASTMLFASTAFASEVQIDSTATFIAPVFNVLVPTVIPLAIDPSASKINDVYRPVDATDDTNDTVLSEAYGIPGNSQIFTSSDVGFTVINKGSSPVKVTVSFIAKVGNATAATDTKNQVMMLDRTKVNGYTTDANAFNDYKELSIVAIANNRALVDADLLNNKLSLAIATTAPFGDDIDSANSTKVAAIGLDAANTQRATLVYALGKGTGASPTNYAGAFAIAGFVNANAKWKTGDLILTTRISFGGMSADTYTGLATKGFQSPAINSAFPFVPSVAQDAKWNTSLTTAQAATSGAGFTVAAPAANAIMSLVLPAYGDGMEAVTNGYKNFVLKAATAPATGFVPSFDMPTISLKITGAGATGTLSFATVTIGTTPAAGAASFDPATSTLYVNAGAVTGVTSYAGLQTTGTAGAKFVAGALTFELTFKLGTNAAKVYKFTHTIS